MSKRTCLGQFLLFLLAAAPVSAQKLHFYRNDGKHNVYETTKLDSITFPDDASKMHLWFKNTAQTDIKRSAIDSITMGDKCQVAQLSINTTDGAAVSSRETYVGCTVSLNGLNMFPNIEQTGKIRGRGNSTWLWYPKKAYRLKLDAKEKMMGLGKSKDWVLLANYRDPTFMMNALAFELGDLLGLQYTNNTRFVELTLNGAYKGLYMLTEQVEQGKNRVDVNDSTGVLLCMDVDDGPTNSPDATDNFWSQTYLMPMCVKYPKDDALTDARKDEIKADFAKLETLIKAHNYTAVKEILDVPSLINFLIVQEMTCNVELEAPRSMFIYKGTNDDNLWHLGPLWDFDGGFSFDWWTDMTTDRDYFLSNTLLLGKNPEANPNGVAHFFIDLFNDSQFKTDFINRWQEVHTTILPQLYSKLDNYKLQIEDAMSSDEACWSLTTKFDEQYTNLQNWLTKHVELMNEAFKDRSGEEDPNANVQLVANPTDVKADYLVTYKEKVAAADGYSGGSQKLTLADAIAEKLGLTDATVLTTALGQVNNNRQNGNTVKFGAINASTGKDYSGSYTANGFGFWLNASGDVCSYNDYGSTFYAELNPDSWIFNYGTYPEKVTAGDVYTATFVLQRTSTGKRVAIRFVLTVN